MNEPSSVRKSERHFLSEVLQVDGRKGLEVGQNLGLIRRTLQDALPDRGVRFGADTVFMIDWAWASTRNETKVTFK